MKEEVKNMNEQVENVEQEQVQEQESNYKAIVRKLITKGCKKINSVRIKNVNCTESDNYVRVSFTLDKPVRGFVSDDNGVTYHEGMTNTVFTSTYAIAGVLKEDEDLGWMANALIAHPDAINLILNGATVDLLQQDVAAGEVFVNPFSNSTSVKEQVYDHDTIINHIIGFKLGKTGERMADKLADKLLGF